MNQKERLFWIKALKGSGKAYRKLGVLYLRAGRGRMDQKLGKLCLEHGIELGDEAAYLIYHRLFSRGKQVIDDRSYAEMWREYRKTGGARKKKRLEAYLKLGTERQKKMTGNFITKKHCNYNENKL